MVKTLMLIACLITLSLVTIRAQGDPPPADAGGFSIKVSLKENAAAFMVGKPMMVHYHMNAPKQSLDWFFARLLEYGMVRSECPRLAGKISHRF